MPKKIAITGPESSGKTTLAQQLAKHFNAIWVPEFARTYLTGLNRPYTIEDLGFIAKGQMEWESNYSKCASNIIFCDSDMTVMKIWSEFRFGYCEASIEKAFENQYYDLTLLCRPDIEWQPDPLRENPRDREALFERYLKALEQKKARFEIIEGDFTMRCNSSIFVIERLLINDSPKSSNK